MNLTTPHYKLYENNNTSWTTLLNPSQPLFIDLETDAFPFPKFNKKTNRWNKGPKTSYGPIVVIGMLQTHWDHVAILHLPNPKFFLQHIEHFHIIAHNVEYEYSCLSTQANIKWIPKKIDDTQVLARYHYRHKHGSIFEKKYVGLEQCFEYCDLGDPYEKYTKSNKKELSTSFSLKHKPSHQQLMYNCIDVWGLPFLFNKMINTAHNNKSYQNAMQTYPTILRMQHNGLNFLQPQLHSKIKQLNEKIKQFNTLPYNINSSQQTTKFYKTKKADKKHIQAIANNNNHPLQSFAQTHIITKPIYKKIEQLQKYIKSNKNKLYGHFIMGTNTGRLNCKQENLQNLHQLDVFGLEPHDTFTFLYFDYNQMEIRIATHFAQEHKLIKLYQQGADIHKKTAAELFHNGDLTKVNQHTRQIAKTLNFSLLYGAGPDRLLLELQTDGIKNVTRNHALALRQLWLNNYPQFNKWHNNVQNLTQNPFGFTKTILGRVATCPLKTPHDLKWRARSTMLNIPVQGTGAEIMLQTIHNIMNEPSIQHDWLINIVHDSFLFKIPDKQHTINNTANIIHKHVNNTWNKIITSVPLPINIHSGKTFNSLLPVHIS